MYVFPQEKRVIILWNRNWWNSAQSKPIRSLRSKVYILNLNNLVMNISRNTKKRWSQGIHWHSFTLIFISPSLLVLTLSDKSGGFFTWVFFITFFFLVKDIIGFLLHCGERLNTQSCFYLQHIKLFKLTLQMLGKCRQGMFHGIWESLLSYTVRVSCTLRIHEFEGSSLVDLEFVKVGHLWVKALRFTHKVKKTQKLSPTSLTGSCHL